MRVEVVWELEEDDDALEIPWADPQDPARCYLDLKAQPERIGTLEEVRAYPLLGEVLTQLNAPDSVFRTAKCDVWTTAELTEDELRDFGRAHKVASYLDLVFDGEGFNFHPDHYQRLGEKLTLLLERVAASAQVEIALRHCLYHPQERWGYHATFFIHGYGADSSQAERAWSRALAEVGEALGRISHILRRALEAPASPPGGP